MKETEIKNIFLRDLRSEEDFGFQTKILELTTNVTVETDQPIIQSYANAVNAWDEVLKIEQKNSHTAAVHAADERADNAWRKANAQAKLLTEYPIEEKRTVAEQAYAIIQKYGDITGMAYNQEYGNMKNLLTELQAMGEEKLTLIDLKVWVDEMQAAYDDYILHSLAQAHEDGDKKKGITNQHRTETDDAYYALIKRINAGAEYNGPEPYVAFIDAVNALIDAAKTTISARKTRAKNKKDKEKEAKATADANLPAEE